MRAAACLQIVHIGKCTRALRKKTSSSDVSVLPKGEDVFFEYRGMLMRLSCGAIVVIGSGMQTHACDGCSVRCTCV